MSNEMAREEYLARKRETNAKYRAKHRESLREKAKDYRENNRETYRRVSRDFKKKKREELVENLGGCCCKCGSKDRLEMDHINPALRTMIPASFVGMAENNPKRVEELKNIQLLCHKCHKEKTTAQKNLSWTLLINMPLEIQEKWLINPPTSLEDIINTLNSYHQQ